MRVYGFLSWLIWCVGSFCFGFTAQAVFGQARMGIVDFPESLETGFITLLTVVILSVRNWAVERQGRTRGALKDE